MKTFAITHLAGGSGRTTTTEKLASSLTNDHEKRVLVIDMSVTKAISRMFLGTVQDQASPSTILHAFRSPQTLPCEINPRLSLFASDETLLRAEEELGRQENADTLLKRFFQVWSFLSQYDYCLIDTHVDMGVLTRNALVAADVFLLPSHTTKSHYDPQYTAQTLENTLTRAQRLRKAHFLDEAPTIIIEQALEDMGEKDWHSLAARVITNFAD